MGLFKRFTKRLAAILAICLAVSYCNDTVAGPDERLLSSIRSPGASRTPTLSIEPDSVFFSFLSDTASLQATVTDTAGTEMTPADVVWVSADTLIAVVDSTGVVTAISEGVASIEAISGELLDTTHVVVDQVAASMEITKQRLVFLQLHEYQQARAVIRDSGGSPMSGTVTWSSPDTAELVIRVPSRCGGTPGLEHPCVRSVGEGGTRLVGTYEGMADTIPVTVVRPHLLRVTSETYYSYDRPGASFQIEIEILDAVGKEIEYAPIVFESSDPAVATVDSAGYIRVEGYGTSIISLKAARLFASVIVEVYSPAAAIRIDPSSIWLYGEGNTTGASLVVETVSGGEYPAFGDVTWETTDSTIVTVGEDTWLLTAGAEGEAAVIAFFGEDGNVFVDTASVTVRYVDRIAIHPAPIHLEAIGDTVHARVEAFYGGVRVAGEIRPVWSSEDPVIAKVDRNGLVSALDRGHTTITAQAGQAISRVAVRVGRDPAPPPPGQPGGRDLVPPVPTGPGLFRGRGPWWEGDTLRYNLGRQNLQEAATLTYELKYRPGGMSDRIEGSPNATVSDTTLSGTVSLEADQSVQLAFRIVDNSIVDDPRDTLMLTVREGPHTYIDRLVVHEGICDRAVPLQTAVLSWLRHGLGVVSTSNVLNPDITPCREPTSEDLEGVQILRMGNIDVLRRASLIPPHSEATATRLSELPAFDLTKADLEGLSGAFRVDFLAFDMTNAEWDQKLFDGMPVLERLWFNGVVLGELPDEAFMGLNPGGLGSADPRCPEITHYDRRCLITDLQFYTNTRIAEEDVTALENPSRTLLAPASTTLRELNMSGVFAPDGGTVVLPPDLFSGFSSLVVLSLVENGLTEMPEAVDFSVLTSLEELNLQYNEIRAFPFEEPPPPGGDPEDPEDPQDPEDPVGQPSYITATAWADYTDTSYKGVLTSAPSSPQEGDFYFVLNDQHFTGADLWVYQSGGWVKHTAFRDYIYTYLLCLANDTQTPLTGNLCISNKIIPFGIFTDDASAEAGLWTNIAELFEVYELGATFTYINTGGGTPIVRSVTLTIDDTQLDQDDPSPLAYVRAEVSTNLKILALGHNQIQELPDDVFTTFPNLEVLGVSNNQLIDLPEGFFANVGETFIDLNFFDNPGAVEFLPEVYQSDSTVTLAMYLGAPKDVSVQVYSHGGHLKDSQGNMVSTMTLPHGTTERSYTVVRDTATTPVQIRYRYLGPDFLAGLVVISSSLHPTIVYGSPSMQITLPERVHDLFDRIDLDTGLDLTPAESELHLNLDTYIEAPPSVDSMRFTATSSMTDSLSATIDSEMLKLRPLAAGTATVTIRASTYTSGALSAYIDHALSVVVHEADKTSYNLRLIDLGNTYSSNKEAREFLENAGALFSSLIAERKDRALYPSTYQCAGNYLAGIEQLPVDDQVIFMTIEEVDGPGNELASALPCVFSLQDSLPVMSDVLVDEADLLGGRISGSVLESTIQHEMFHTLGLGAAFGPGRVERYADLVEGADTDSARFTGSEAVLAYGDAMDGVPYPFDRTRIVPLESAGDHWHEEIMGNELMTPQLSMAGEVSPRSAITIRALADMGYTLKSGWESFVEPYTLPYARPDMAGAVAEEGEEGPPFIDLSGDLRKGPITLIGPDGKVIRVILPRNPR